MKKNWISLLALTLSIIACIITWLRVEIYTTNDTFVGIMTGFMGACATIIVGFQIFNSIDTRNRLKEIESLQIQLKKEIKECKSKELVLESLTQQAHAITIYKEQPFSAYYTLFRALINTLKVNDSKYISVLINNMDTLVERIERLNYEEIVLYEIEKIKSIDLENLKQYQSFTFIEDKIYNIHQHIMDYIEKIEEERNA